MRRNTCGTVACVPLDVVEAGCPVLARPTGAVINVGATLRIGVAWSAHTLEPPRPVHTHPTIQTGAARAFIHVSSTGRANIP